MTAKTASHFPFALCLLLSRVKIARLPIVFSVLAVVLLCGSVQPIWAQADPTTTTIVQSGSAGNYTLTATVTGFGGAAAPTGTVSFLDTSNAGAVVGTAPLGSGTGSAGMSWTNSQTPATKPGPQSIAVGDFNGDGKADIAVGAPGFVSILLGKGDGTFTVNAADNFAALSNNQSMAAAKFITGGPDGILTFSNSTSGTNNAQMIYGNGTGGETVGSPFSPGLTSVSAVATGDFNGDGKQDFVIAGLDPITSNPAIAVVLGNGNGTFGTPTLLPQDDTIQAIGVGDFIGNGNADIAVMTAITGTSDLHVASVFENDGSGNFSAGPSISESGLNPVSMVVADFNGDGKADLAVVNSGDNTVTILLSAGDGTFKQLASPSTGSSPSSIAVGDFNGDKIVDLAVANSGSNSVTILLGNGDGTFTAGTSPATGKSPISLAVGGFNGSGTSDLAIANSADSTVTVLLSQSGLTATATATKIAVAGSGAHLVDASYPGNGTYAPSVSGTTSLSANIISTALALTANPSSVALGQQVLLTATLSPYSSGSTITNGEMVTFSNGVTSLGTGTLSSGVATLNTTSLPAGTDSVTAKYAGDANFNTSTSSAVSVVVGAPVPAVTLNSGSLTFASQLVGSTSAAQSITLTNTGQAALSISSIAASGDFAETNTCGSSVAAGGMCSISVKFTPTTAGARSGTLTITDNAGGSPQTVTLNGTGESVGLTSSATALTISSSGGSAMATIQLSPLSGFTGTVNLTCSVTYQGKGTSKLPPTCTMNPAQAQITGNSGVSSTLTVSTSKNAASATSAAGVMNTAGTYEQALRNSGVVLAALFLFGIAPRRRWRKGLLFGFLCMMVVGGMVGCGSSSNQGTTAGSYQVAVTATSGSATASTMIPLSVQ